MLKIILNGFLPIAILILIAPAFVVAFRGHFARSVADTADLQEFMSTWAGLVALAVPVFCAVIAAHGSMGAGQAVTLSALAVFVALYCYAVKFEATLLHARPTASSVDRRYRKALHR